MRGPLIAVVGDATDQRNYDPPMKDPARARAAAEAPPATPPTIAIFMIYSLQHVAVEFVIAAT